MVSPLTAYRALDLEGDRVKRRFHSRANLIGSPFFIHFLFGSKTDLRESVAAIAQRLTSEEPALVSNRDKAIDQDLLMIIKGGNAGRDARKSCNPLSH
jgi:hypothetical protein